MWDHTDDVEFLRPCLCLQGPDIVEGLAAVQTIVEQAHRDGQRPDALDRLVATFKIADETHRAALIDELTDYLSVHIDTDPDVTRYFQLARFYRRLATLPLRTRLGQADEQK